MESARKHGRTAAKAMDALIARATDGTTTVQERLRAFEEIVRRYQDMAYGYAYALLGDAHPAKDAAQEAFIVAWRRLGDLRTAEASAGCGVSSDLRVRSQARVLRHIGSSDLRDARDRQDVDDLVQEVLALLYGGPRRHFSVVVASGTLRRGLVVMTNSSFGPRVSREVVKAAVGYEYPPSRRA